MIVEGDIMKEERKTIFIGSILNFIVASLKLFGALIFQFNSLLVDSIYTFCDFTTDIISIIGSKIAGKRPTKYHPFGFGRVEYLTNLFIGIVMTIISTIILYHSFKSEYEIPDIRVIFIILIAINIKITMLNFLKIRNKKIKSHPLAEGIEESTIDLFSTILVAIAVILLQFSDKVHIFRYCDIVASSIISFMIIRTSWMLIKHNILNLLGTVEMDTELIDHVKSELNAHNKYDIYKIELIKYGRYYKAHLVIGLDGNMTLKKVKKIQQEITYKLKQIRKIRIKVVNIDVDLLKK